MRRQREGAHLDLALLDAAADVEAAGGVGAIAERIIKATENRLVAKDAGQRLADESRLQGEHLRETAVGEDDAALAVDGEDAFAHAVHDLLQQRVLKFGAGELARQLGSRTVEARGDFVERAEGVDVERRGGFAVRTAEAIGK